MIRALLSSGATMTTPAHYAEWETRIARVVSALPTTPDAFLVRILHSRLGRRPLIHVGAATNADVTALLQWAVAHRITIDILRLDTL